MKKNKCKVNETSHMHTKILCSCVFSELSNKLFSFPCPLLEISIVLAKLNVSPASSLPLPILTQMILLKFQLVLTIRLCKPKIIYPPKLLIYMVWLSSWTWLPLSLSTQLYYSRKLWTREIEVYYLFSTFFWNSQLKTPILLCPPILNHYIIIIT